MHVGGHTLTTLMFSCVISIGDPGNHFVPAKTPLSELTKAYTAVNALLRSGVISSDTRLQLQVFLIHLNQEINQAIGEQRNGDGNNVAAD